METLSLKTVRRMLEGVIPPAMCSVSPDGVPHVNFLSHAEYVDAEHLALTYQFFNRSRVNVLATGRVALIVDDPYTGASVEFQLRYLRTESSGPLFERLRARLAGIAAHTGMEKVFKLQGADLYRVECIRRLDALLDLPAMAPRCDVAAGARNLAQALAECTSPEALLETLMQGLPRELGIQFATLWLLDESRQGLFSLASCGYPEAGTGAELLLSDAGLTGVAVREGVPIRIGCMSNAYLYGQAWRSRAQQLGLEAVLQREVPLPGLERPRSQLAVPLRARGRTVGALLVESDHEEFFSYDDEDALVLLASQLAQALAAMPMAEPDALSTHAGASAAPSGAPLRVHHYARDDSVFLDDAYLIKGVAGAILRHLVDNALQSGRTDFSTRELRLLGERLRLPDVQDNLSVRLLLLQRRLDERQADLRIERTGRGQFRLVAQRPLALTSDAD